MTNINQIAYEIARQLRVYGNILQEDVEKEAKRLAQEGRKRLKVTSPIRTGAYARGWKVKKKGKNYVIYNSNYRLTHLLEKRHKKKGGKGFTAPQKHIEPVETFVVREFTEFIERLARR